MCLLCGCATETRLPPSGGAATSDGGASGAGAVATSGGGETDGARPQVAPVDAATTSDAPDVDAAMPYIDPLQCHLLCASTDGANCANAPDHQTCFDLCERSIARCPADVLRLLDCFGPVPSFACDADGNVAAPSCTPELEIVQACAVAGDGG
jgi:hypothetical protein